MAFSFRPNRWIFLYLMLLSTSIFQRLVIFSSPLQKSQKPLFHYIRPVQVLLAIFMILRYHDIRNIVLYFISWYPLNCGKLHIAPCKVICSAVRTPFHGLSLTTQRHLFRSTWDTKSTPPMKCIGWRLCSQLDDWHRSFLLQRQLPAAQPKGVPWCPSLFASRSRRQQLTIPGTLLHCHEMSLPRLLQ